MTNDMFNDLRENSRFYGVKVTVQVRDAMSSQRSYAQRSAMGMLTNGCYSWLLPQDFDKLNMPEGRDL